MAQKKKKTKRRKLTPIVRLLCLVMIGLSCFMLYQVGTEVLTTVRNKPAGFHSFGGREL